MLRFRNQRCGVQVMVTIFVSFTPETNLKLPFNFDYKHTKKLQMFIGNVPAFVMNTY